MSRPFLLNRRIHYWIAIATAAPVLVIIVSGLLLQAKKHWAWVQPPEQRGTGTAPAIELTDVLTALAGVPGMQVDGWDDVRRLDVRPGRGLAKAWLANGYEVQIDLGTGAVLQTAYRRSDLLESLHDGSFFAGDWTRLGLFLPAGLALLVLWGTGLWLWWVPFRAKRIRARLARERAD
jgi:hypothetical protein